MKTEDSKGRIEVEGVMSHFATADDVNPRIMEEQVDTFKSLYNSILEYGHTPKYRHIGNSASVFSLNSDFFDAWRVGLALYGYNPLSLDHPQYALASELKPAMEIWTRVISIHHISMGE
ncbi:MAG: hypothetical protein GXP45_03455 [bacterium]|nr:hypothetical protein [bacterium]